MKVILLGAGEHARVVAEAATTAGWQVLASLAHEQQDALPGLLLAHPDALLHLAIGANRARAAVAARHGDQPWATIIHPRAIVAPSARLAPGVFVGAGAVIQTAAVVGAHALVNTAAVVEHDCVLGACCHIAPGAVLGGGATVGDQALIGLGARVRDHIAIGDGAIVGMGAAVIATVAAGTTVVGVPARVQP